MIYRFTIYDPENRAVAQAREGYAAVGAALLSGEGSTICLTRNSAGQPRTVLLEITEDDWDSYDGTVALLYEAEWLAVRSADAAAGGDGAGYAEESLARRTKA